MVALHVHHGLQPEADAWLAHLRAPVRGAGPRAACRCACRGARLQGAPAAGDSIEAWARRERYRGAAPTWPARAAPTLVLLAHHRRDQAETFLLQALRGAGAGRAGGDAARGRSATASPGRGPGWTQPREAIDAYVRRHRLRYVDDASNADRALRAQPPAA